MTQDNTASQLDDDAVDSDVDGADQRSPQSPGARMREGAATNDASSDGGGALSADLALVMDIPVTLSMEIGQTRISIRELLKLSKGSVVELQRMADEPLDVLINGTLVARGEAVVVGDRFGIRLTDVISPQERLRKVT